MLCTIDCSMNDFHMPCYTKKNLCDLIYCGICVFVIETEFAIALSYAYTTDCGKFCSVFTDLLLSLLALCSFRVHQMSPGDIAFTLEVSQVSHLSFQPCTIFKIVAGFSCP